MNVYLKRYFNLKATLYTIFETPCLITILLGSRDKCIHVYLPILQIWLAEQTRPRMDDAAKHGHQASVDDEFHEIVNAQENGD